MTFSLKQKEIRNSGDGSGCGIFFLYVFLAQSPSLFSDDFRAKKFVIKNRNHLIIKA